VKIKKVCVYRIGKEEFHKKHAATRHLKALKKKGKRKK
jgi:hypothetical protein